ncbi:hypothetical protein [Micromonospora humida]|uniref:hypothetical protein n=1 Tax=Micromonospora humida TaxID=2809018 RepID=UPI0033FB278D
MSMLDVPPGPTPGHRRVGVPADGTTTNRHDDEPAGRGASVTPVHGAAPAPARHDA